MRKSNPARMKGVTLARQGYWRRKRRVRRKRAKIRWLFSG
jgi:hypothetical protein